MGLLTEIQSARANAVKEVEHPIAFLFEGHLQNQVALRINKVLNSVRSISKFVGDENSSLFSRTGSGQSIVPTFDSELANRHFNRFSGLSRMKMFSYNCKLIQKKTREIGTGFGK